MKKEIRIENIVWKAFFNHAVDLPSTFSVMTTSKERDNEEKKKRISVRANDNQGVLGSRTARAFETVGLFKQSKMKTAALLQFSLFKQNLIKFVHKTVIGKAAVTNFILLVLFKLLNLEAFG